MKQPFLLLTLGAGLLFAQSPATFEDLDIVYRLDAGPRLTETRAAQIRLNSAVLAPALRQIVLPKLNAKGSAELRDLALIRSGREIAVVKPSMHSTRASFFWDIAEAQVGDEIRFSTTQPVDLTVDTAGAWWYESATTIPLPVEHGSVRFIPPAGFDGSVDSIDPRDLGGGYAWRLDGISTTTHAARFVASSFQSWQQFSAWALARCPAEGATGLGALGQFRTAAELAAGLSERLTVTDSTTFPCRPVEEVLTSGTASAVEAATVFASALASIQVPADRFLLSAASVPEAVNPATFQGAIVRVRSPEGVLWFDSSHFNRVSGGLRLTTGTESALSMQTTDAHWLAPLVSQPEIRLEPGRLAARVEASITESGTLLGTVTMEANGAAESTLNSGSNQIGSFLKDRRVAAQPESTASPERMTRRIVMREDQFVLPIERVKQTPLNAFPLVQDPIRLPNGGVYLGAPGIYREQIDLGIATNRRIKAGLHLDVDRPFAHYRSDAAVLDGKLVVTRELQLLSASVAPGDVSSAQSFVAQIREDQERSFLMTRLGEVDWKAWTDSIPPQQLDELAYKAYSPNGEYQAALTLLERSTQVNTRSAYAWGLTATIRMMLGQLPAAKIAYQKQLELEPANVTARLALDGLLVQFGEAETVIKNARARLAVNPNDAFALGSLENAYLKTGNWADAEDAGNRYAETLTDRATQSTARLLPLAMKTCQGNLANAAAEFQSVLGPNAPALNASFAVTFLRVCDKGLELADGFCRKYLELMQPFVPSATTNLLSLTAFPQTFSSWLSLCGDVKIKMGDIDTGLEWIRAAALIFQNYQSASHAAQSLWDAGHHEEAEKFWVEAVSFDAAEIDEVPKEIRERVRTTNLGMAFPGWIPVPDAAPGAAELMEGKVEPGEELFFLARADESGVVTRAFDLNREPAASVQFALRGMKVPVIPLNGRTIPSVHVIMVRNIRGKVEVFRSFSPPAIRMVQSMRQDLFRPPQPSFR